METQAEILKLAKTGSLLHLFGVCDDAVSPGSL